MKEKSIEKAQELVEALLKLREAYEYSLINHSEDWQDTDAGEECVGNIHLIQEMIDGVDMIIEDLEKL